MSTNIGLEVEGFGQAREYGHYEEGEITFDASPDLTELIGPPSTLQAVLDQMAALALRAGPNITFCPKRPDHLKQGAGQWRPEVRYQALKEALSRECPDSWQGVHIMTNRAATHVNVGIDWATSAGQVVLSLFNNIGPYVAAKLHNKHGIGCQDLLSPWQGWASEKRLPAPYRWWNSTKELETYYGKIPCLIRKGVGAEPEIVPDLSLFSGNMSNRLHLGTVWLFARPKVSDSGIRYIEIRLLASMDPCAQAFRDIISEMFELLVAVAHHAKNGCQKSEATDLLSDLRSRHFGDLLPEDLLGFPDWEQTGTWRRQCQIVSAA